MYSPTSCSITPAEASAAAQRVSHGALPGARHMCPVQAASSARPPELLSSISCWLIRSYRGQLEKPFGKTKA